MPQSLYPQRLKIRRLGRMGKLFLGFHAKNGALARLPKLSQLKTDMSHRRHKRTPSHAAVHSQRAPAEGPVDCRRACKGAVVRGAMGV